MGREERRVQGLDYGQTDSQVVASWKLGSTCDSVWPGLACTCVDLRWLAMTCDHFGRDQICTQVNASFLPFGHPTQVSSRSSSICRYLLLLASPFDQGFTLMIDVMIITTLCNRPKVIYVLNGFSGKKRHRVGKFSIKLPISVRALFLPFSNMQYTNDLRRVGKSRTGNTTNWPR